MTQYQVKEVLKQNKLSVTTARVKILELFLQKEVALTHADIEKGFGKEFDRVTIYRTLQSFVEAGLIHTIPSAKDSITYGLCINNCSHGHHHDNHVHFVCNVCHNTLCIADVLIPKVTLPENFVMKDAQMIVQGVCGNCAN
jgi:Fur family transcriptional regulator, ferric uptake regulator